MTQWQSLQPMMHTRVTYGHTQYDPVAIRVTSALQQTPCYAHIRQYEPVATIEVSAIEQINCYGHAQYDPVAIRVMSALQPVNG